MLCWILLGCLISCATCIKPEPRIAGGTEVKNRSKFAYQAALLYKGVPFCGGTIIDERHILTAGNCCKPNLKLLVKPSEVAVAVGNLNLYDTSNVKQVQNVFIHESYDPVTLANNIAVLRISGSFNKWTDDIRPINLTTTNLVNNTTCIVSGWGTTLDTIDDMNSKLLYAEVPIVDWETCNKAYSAFTYPIGDKAICAGTTGKDFCQGDNGGPLVCDNSLAGIISFGYGCSYKNYPSVYTEVSKYLKWIEDQKTRPSSWAESKGTRFFLLLLLLKICYIL
jgi:trypsin